MSNKAMTQSNYLKVLYKGKWFNTTPIRSSRSTVVPCNRVKLKQTISTPSETKNRPLKHGNISFLFPLIQGRKPKIPPVKKWKTKKETEENQKW